MSNSTLDNDDKSTLGCLMIIGLGIFGSIIIQVLYAIATLAVIGGIFYGIYYLESRNGFFTNLFDYFNDLIDSNRSQTQHSRTERRSRHHRETERLAEGKHDELLNSIGVLIGKMGDVTDTVKQNSAAIKKLQDDLPTIIDEAVDKKFKEHEALKEKEKVSNLLKNVK